MFIIKTNISELASGFIEYVNRRVRRRFALRRREHKSCITSPGLDCLTKKIQFFQRFRVIVFFVTALTWLPQSTLGNEVDNTGSEAAEKTLAERFSMNFKLLTTLTIQEPAGSTQNPGNNFL